LTSILEKKYCSAKKNMASFMYMLLLSLTFLTAKDQSM